MSLAPGVGPETLSDIQPSFDAFSSSNVHCSDQLVAQPRNKEFSIGLVHRCGNANPGGTLLLWLDCRGNAGDAARIQAYLFEVARRISLYCRRTRCFGPALFCRVSPNSTRALSGQTASFPLKLRSAF